MPVISFQSVTILEKDRTGKTAAHYCAENQNLNCITRILTSEPRLLNQKDEEGYTPLHLAVIAGNKVVLKYLISKGAHVNAVDNEGHSAVHWATGRK
jgi:ankyrin repeat protein